MVALFDNPTIVHNENNVGFIDGLESVRNNE